MKFPIALLASFQLAGIALANNWIHESVLANDHTHVARSVAPKFVFHKSESCFPTAAIRSDGSQMPWGLNACPRSYSSFPTYFMVRYCEYPGKAPQWRVLFDVYMPYSPNIINAHDHDWEYVIVGLKQVAGRGDWWVRDHITLAAHDRHEVHGWNGYLWTFFGGNHNDIKKNADHAYVFVEAAGHGMTMVDPRDSNAGSSHWAADNLYGVGSDFPKHNWGSTAAPWKFRAYEPKFDLCHVYSTG